MLLRDICESRFQLNEVKDRTGVLGVVEGVFFVPETPSRNGRVYPRSLWERALSSDDVRRLLENRLLIGTVGHEDVDFDALIREQKVSHVVTDLWLGEDGRGYGRAEILDTPVGRILYTLLKSGSKLAVSSKGWGEYKGTNEQGLYIVDESSYVLERFDFVVDPGFIEAIPGLKRQYESLVIKKEGEHMEKFEKLVEEKVKLQERLGDVLKELEKVKNSYDEAVKQVEELKKKLKEVGEKGKQEEKQEWRNKRGIYEQYLGVSEEKDVQNEIRMIAKLIEERAEGLVKQGVSERKLEGESLSEVLVKVFMYEDRMQRRSNKEQRKLYEARLERYKKMLREAKGVISAVNAMGGLDKITESLMKVRKIVRYMTEQKLKEAVEKLSARYGVDKKDVQEMVEKLGVSGAEKMLKKRMSEVREKREVVKVVKEESRVNETLAGRIMGIMNFGVKSSTKGLNE